MKGDVGRGLGGVGESKGRCEVCEEVWESVGRGMEGVGKCVGCGGGEKKFGERYGGSGKS